LTVLDAARLARDLFNLDVSAEALPSERDTNFRLSSGHVLKIANPAESLDVLDLQNRAFEHLAASSTSLIWPRVTAKDRVRLLTWIDGTPLACCKPHLPELLRSLGRAVADTDMALARFSHAAAHRTFYWDLRQAQMAEAHLYLLTPAQRRLVEPIFAEWRKIDWSVLPHSIIHGDANDYNVLVRDDRVIAILDLGDMVHTATVCDLAIAMAYAMLDKPGPLAAADHVTAGYEAVRLLARAERNALPALVKTRLAMSVCYCAWQSSQHPENEYLKISNRPAWALLEQLMTPASLLARRRAHLGPSLSISYREPLHIVRGSGAYLYDSAGRAYLDCVNNVAHVGHCHPRVVRAAAEQMAMLNTNTRYLHEHLVAYIERLTALLPEPLSVVYLVNSGSEANELALRLARAHTGRDGVIVVETAYHGNTNALIDISPYKFNGPGGRGRPAHVQVVPYVGQASGLPNLDNTAAFFCESALSCAGQVILRPGYLREAYEAIRAAGGVCVADEVQTGFGRAGSHFWMFETQDVVPDIVTLGKPIGNGHPMGAVITTPAIAESFANGMEYFNTFGGNPVSCAVGLAVLDVIRDERLQENASEVGKYLMRGLGDLQQRHPAITDVRGLGLFLGFELTNGEIADNLVNDMKERGVLLSTDGPLHNVIKIKPPIVFSRADAGLLLDRLDTVLP
jgi:4-aminobutyrate aminotransferase-like enzyme/Ser/Thr protein kinase RdoA (MazF antagonist)